MNRRITGVALLVVSTSLFVRAFDYFTNGWYLILGLGRSMTAFEYSIFFGQLLVYLTTYTVVVLYSITLIRRRHVKQQYSWLIWVVIVWFILEVPLYPCEFGQSHHTFWKSHKLHFH